MTSVMALNDVRRCMLECDTVQLLAGFPQCNGGKLERAEDFKCISLCIVCLNRNTSALLLSNNLLLYQDK